jgi:Integrase core domain
MRREFLDQVLFWNARDLERKLADFQAYYNTARSHASLEGHTPLTFVGGHTVAPANLNNVHWVSHCRDLVQLPVAAWQRIRDQHAFGGEIDYAMLVKIYGASGENETRYSPAKCLGSIPTPVTGDPDPKHISTSYVERANLTMRMSMRRFTRLTNAFSKNWRTTRRWWAYTSCITTLPRVHQPLRVAPAMEAGVSDHVWSVDEIIGLLE